MSIRYICDRFKSLETRMLEIHNKIIDTEHII